MNKFEEWLNEGNTIAVASSKDFNEMRELCEKIGINFFNNAFGHKPSKPRKANYFDLCVLAQNNNCLINGGIVLVEHQISKGLTFGYKTFKQSSDWYGKNPYTVEEVLQSIKENSYE